MSAVHSKENSMDVSEQHISDIKFLVGSGDIVLANERAKFKRIKGRDTLLDDDKLCRAIAMTDDDDDDLFVSMVEAVEAGE
jgi:hypothetical protein